LESFAEFGELVKKDLRGTWRQAFLTFFAPILLISFTRWALVEPFVIPSGSMIPNLLIHDHIFASKLSYGLHVPFSSKWLTRWAAPQRGEVVVFRYPKNPDVYYVKRIIGLPGDQIRMSHGVVFVNGQAMDLVPLPGKEQEEGFAYFTENGHHIVRYQNKDQADYDTIQVPESHYFALGDNRDQSADSRVWGFVPENNLVGRAKLIWLSCAKTLPSASFLCDPQTLRLNRFLISVE
jgi:signal peptidase I